MNANTANSAARQSSAIILHISIADDCVEAVGQHRATAPACALLAMLLLTAWGLSMQVTRTTAELEAEFARTTGGGVDAWAPLNELVEVGAVHVGVATADLDTQLSLHFEEASL